MVLRVRSLASIVFAVAIVLGFAGNAAIASDAAKTVGPNTCGECHKEETAAWQESHHFKTFRDMPRNPKGKEIGEKMGIKRVNSAGLCLTCHYTVDSKEKPVAGISCESCHSPAKDWVKIHGEFSGKSEKTESKAEEEARWKLAESKGMIRPDNLYELAKNCYSCHVVPQEDLVNKGGHKAGSDFELVSWSQGEVRHTTWYTKGKENTPANANRKRMLYLVGLGVELETGIRSIAKATARQPYAFDMAKRVDRARKLLAAAAKAVPGVPEIGKLVEFAYSAGLKLDNEPYLTAAAEGVSKTLVAITAKYDGSTMAGLDSVIPGPDKYKGTARKPGGGS
jgi:Cytochrome c554 and c-prime